MRILDDPKHSSPEQPRRIRLRLSIKFHIINEIKWKTTIAVHPAEIRLHSLENKAEQPSKEKIAIQLTIEKLDNGKLREWV